MINIKKGNYEKHSNTSRDSFYQDMLKNIDIQSELKKMMDKAIYSKEYKIANDIKQGINEIKQNKTKPIENLLHWLHLS